MKVLRIVAILLACLAFTVTTSMAGGKKKTKVSYKCYENGERVPCPENFKESPEFKQYQRQKKMRHYDTRRHYIKDSEASTERFYHNDKDSKRTYYDETIREEAEEAND